MTDNVQHSSTGIVKLRSTVTPATDHNSIRSTKNNQIMNLHKDIYQDPSENHIVIKAKKNPFRKSQLKESMTVMPLFSMGIALRTVKITIEDEESYEIERLSRFPNSFFKIHETNEKNRRFNLASNFYGSKYNLFEEDNLLLSINYESGMCGSHPTRSFSFCFLAPKIHFSSLHNPQKVQDLEILFNFPENNGKIMKFFTEKPVQNSEGEYTLSFSQKHVLPAVQNAVIVDAKGKHYMQIVKVDFGLFEINTITGVPRQYGVALALSTFDFKIALE